ncbi:MAG TPA: O-antigen ligase family protein [Solirubrobacteraceae bacterium]
MSVWLTQRGKLSSWHRGLDTASGIELLLLPVLAATLFVRALTDDLSPADSRHTGTIDLSGAIAVLFMLVAAGMLLRRRHGLLPTALAVLWLCIWTAVAVNTNGASGETVREGVREISVVAVFVIVYNARGVTVPIATRLVQLMGFVPALVALYQLVTFTSTHRAYGTFAHPDTAAMFFAIAATASLWRWLDSGRRRLDAILMALFAAALVATASIDGLITLATMLTALGLLRPGSLRSKLSLCAIAGVLVLAFFATPLGAHHIARESTTNIETTGEPNSSLAWRLHKWKTLIPAWEKSPIFGRGLGTTTTDVGPPGNPYVSKPPHNEYIRYLVETGVVGLTTLLAALALLIRSLTRRRRIPGTMDEGTLNASSLALAIVVGCLVNSLADNTLLASPTGYAATLIIAAVLALPVGSITRPGRQRSS